MDTNLTWPDYMFAIRFFTNHFKHLLLLLSENIETNYGPERLSNIKFCHWNLNGLTAPDFWGGFYYKYHDRLERFCANFDLLLFNINNLHPNLLNCFR